MITSSQLLAPAAFRLPVRCSPNDGALQWQSLGKQPRGPSEAYGNSIKTRTSGSRAGAVRSTELAISSWFSSAASRLPLWFSPVCLNLRYPGEQIHFFIRQFHLLLIQFSNLFDFKTLPLVFLNNHLAEHCNIQQSELLQTKDCICFYLGTEEKEEGGAELLQQQLWPVGPHSTFHLLLGTK